MAAVRSGRREVALERVRHLSQRDAVLRSTWAGHAGHDAAEVELEELVELGRRPGQPPQALLARVPLDELDLGGRASGQAQIGERLLVDREDARRGTVLGGHVGERGAVGQAERGETVARELHELADHAVAPQQLTYDEDEVSRRRAAWQGAVQAHTDDLRQWLVQRLAQEHGLRLDAADAVAEDAERADHRGV